jgi:hypothetical protein
MTATTGRCLVMVNYTLFNSYVSDDVTCSLTVQLSNFMQFIFKNPVPLSKRTLQSSPVKRNKLELLREIVAIFVEPCETHK